MVIVEHYPIFVTWYSNSLVGYSSPGPARFCCNKLKDNSKYFHLGKLVLSHGNPLSFWVQGNVRVGYFHIEKVEGELIPSLVRGNHLSLFS